MFKEYTTFKITCDNCGDTHVDQETENSAWDEPLALIAQKLGWFIIDFAWIKVHACSLECLEKAMDKVFKKKKEKLIERAKEIYENIHTTKS